MIWIAKELENFGTEWNTHLTNLTTETFRTTDLEKKIAYKGL